MPAATRRCCCASAPQLPIPRSLRAPAAGRSATYSCSTDATPPVPPARTPSTGARMTTTTDRANATGEAAQPADDQLVYDLAHLTDIERDTVDAFWRAANYLTVGQIYLGDDP